MKSLEHSKNTAGSRASAVQRVSQSTKTIVNNRPQAIAQRKLQEVINNRNQLTIQRVKYKNAVYSPSQEDQENFLRIAKADLVSKSAWISGRSEKVTENIGRTDLEISNTDELIAVENDNKYWQEFHKQIEGDIIRMPLVKLSELSLELKVLINNAHGLPSTPDPVDLCLKALSGEALLIDSKTEVGLIKAVDNICRLYNIYKNSKPEEASTKILAQESAIKEAEMEIESLTKEGKKTHKAETRLGKAQQALEKLNKSKKLVSEETERLISLVKSIPTSLRESANNQFNKGKTGYRFSKHAASNVKKNKLYIGQIEDTKAIKQKNEKGKGVLWASPWSPGVNVGFIEGGIEGGQIFKLKTSIPNDLAGFLKTGNINEFKAAVKDQTDTRFYPFWQSQQNRYTLFTQELETLINSGYRLRVFKSSKQIMAKDSHMVELNEYYST